MILLYDGRKYDFVWTGTYMCNSLRQLRYCKVKHYIQTSFLVERDFSKMACISMLCLIIFLNACFVR